MSATVDTRPDPKTLPAFANTTSGRSGASYRDFLAKNPQFDPWTNLDQHAGQGASQDPIFRFAFAKTNDWARANGYGDGANIPLAQRQQVFMANVERARQQWTDLEAQTATDPNARAGMQGVTWGTSAASRLPSQGWGYTANWGLQNPGMSWETKARVPNAVGPSGGGGAGSRDVRGQPAGLGTASGGQGSGGRDTRGGAQAITAPAPLPTGATGGSGATGGAGQRGGSTVVAPALGGSATDPYNPVQNIDPATGRPVVAGAQTTGGAGGGGLYAAQLATDPAARAAALLQRLGFGSLASQYTPLGQAVQKQAQMFDPWMRTQGLDANGQPLLDNASGLLDQFAEKMRGGGFFGSVANDARKGLGSVFGGNSILNPQEMPTSELDQLLQGFNDLIYAGVNPWLQKAYGRRTEDALNQFYQAQGTAAQGGQNLGYADYLQGDPRFRFLTGR
jgi:hypothetical protein